MFGSFPQWWMRKQLDSRFKVQNTFEGEAKNNSNIKTFSHIKLVFIQHQVKPKKPSKTN